MVAQVVAQVVAVARMMAQQWPRFAALQTAHHPMRCNAAQPFFSAVQALRNTGAHTRQRICLTAKQMAWRYALLPPIPAPAAGPLSPAAAGGRHPGVCLPVRNRPARRAVRAGLQFAAAGRHRRQRHDRGDPAHLCAGGGRGPGLPGVLLRHPAGQGPEVVGRCVGGRVDVWGVGWGRGVMREGGTVAASAT